jgi:hypothetical protein
MKRVLSGLLLIAFTLALRPLVGADEAALLAERQNMDERYKKMVAMVEDLLAAQATFQKRIGSLSDDLQNLREENLRSQGKWASRDDLKRLADRIADLEKRREEDRRVILEEIKKLANTPPPVLPEPSVPKKSRKPEPQVQDPTPIPEKGYEYEVKDGDTVAAIVAGYREKGVKTSVDQVLKANPSLKPNKLKKGQKIFIPDPNLK